MTRAVILQGAENQRLMKEAEDKILEVLSTSEGNLLDDSTAVDTLSETKVLADTVAEKQKVAAVTERSIDEARSHYSPLAAHAARLYFVVASMGSVDPMYQFSLPWYIGHFHASMEAAAPASQPKQRLANLTDTFLYVTPAPTLTPTRA